MHRPGVCGDRPLLRGPVPAEGAHHAAQPQRRLHGRSTLVQRPDPVHLAPGRHRARSAAASGVPARRLGRRVRQAPLQVRDRWACESQPPSPRRGDRHGFGPESPRRRPAAGPHRHPRLRRRDELRVGEHPHDPGQGPRGRGVEQLHLHRRGRVSRPAEALRRPRDHAGGHGPVRRARGDHPARADRGIQVRPGRQAGPGRAPAGRQEHPGGRPHARGRGRQRSVQPVPLPQRLQRGGPQEAPGLDQGSEPHLSGEREGLDAHRRGHGGRGQLLRGRPHHPPGRQLRRHRRRSGHRQEEHRDAHRVRHSQGAQVPLRRGHSGEDHADRLRRHPHGLRRTEGHRLGRRRRGDRHGRDGGPGLRAMRLLRERPGLPARHRLHRPRIDDADEPGVGHPAADQPPERLARADGGRARRGWG